MKKNTIITISRQYGSGGRLIGQKLAERLGIPFYDKELITLAAEESGFAENYVKEAGEYTPGGFLSSALSNRAFGPTNEDILWEIQCRVISELAEKGPCVIVGRCADYVLRNMPNVLNVFIHSDMESKVRRVVEDYGVESDNVVELINKTDKRRANYYNYYTGMKWGRAENYHLALRTDCLGIDGAVDTLVHFIEARNAEMERAEAETE